MKPDRPPRFYPDTPLKLSKHLDRIKTGLKMVGIHFERGNRGKKGQKVRIWLDGQENDPPAPLQPPGTPDY